MKRAISTFGKVLLIFLPLILVLALVIVLSVRDARNRVPQEPEPIRRVVISQEVVQRHIQANAPTSVSSVDGSCGYEFTVQDTRVIAACDRDGALITYTYGTAGGYYESTFTDGALSEISHSVMYEMRTRTVRSGGKPSGRNRRTLPEIRRYLAAFTSGEVPFDEAYREIDLLISIRGRNCYFTRIGGAWRAAPAQDAGQRMD